MANRKSVGPDDVSAEVIKLFLNGDLDLLHDFHDVVVAVWQTGEVLQQWKDATIKALFNKKGTRWSAGTAEASPSWPTPAKCCSRSSPRV